MVRKGKGEKIQKWLWKRGRHQERFSQTLLSWCRFFPSHFILLTPWELRAASCASVTLLEWLVTGTAYIKPVLDGEKRKKQG